MGIDGRQADFPADGADRGHEGGIRHAGLKQEVCKTGSIFQWHFWMNELDGVSVIKVPQDLPAVIITIKQFAECMGGG